MNVEQENLVRAAAQIPLDLSYKGESPVVHILTAGVAHLNGRYGNCKYLPDTEKHSRPYHNFDDRIDMTIS
jgi:hypothetical protein